MRIPDVDAKPLAALVKARARRIYEYYKPLYLLWRRYSAEPQIPQNPRRQCDEQAHG
jgi:hypothetical protein